jgi:hypothetical protein
MTGDRGSRLIPASITVVRDILLRPVELPSWNPAFLAIEGPVIPRAGRIYKLTALHGLRGTFQYSAISETVIEMTWVVPGLREECSWTLHPRANDVVEVSHEVHRSGLLAVALRTALSGLAVLRLDRLDGLARVASGHGRVPQAMP